MRSRRGFRGQYTDFRVGNYGLRPQWHLLKPNRRHCEERSDEAISILLAGVYVSERGRLRFQRVKAPNKGELESLVHTVSERLGRYLERQGLLVRDMDNSYLALEPRDEADLEQVLGSSITYRIAIGPQQGRKAFTLQTLPAQGNREESSTRVAKACGFSVHAGVVAEAHERKKLERLCRYITRPAIAEQRLSLTAQGWVRYQLKTPYRDGTTHVVLEPLDFIARLAALIPKPRVNLTRYHGVFAPNSAQRSEVTPGQWGRRVGARTPEKPRQRMCREPQ